MPRLPRTAKQITAIPTHTCIDHQGKFELYPGCVVALCDDGTIWVKQIYDSKTELSWIKLPEIPQTD